MSTVSWRWDYAKFVFDLPRGLFRQYYQELNRLSHERKFHGDWLSSHKVMAWPNQNVDRETTCIEIWGEWTGLIEALDYQVWAPAAKRLDVRAALWDVDGTAILHTGQHIQRTGCGYNVEVFNSKPANKRLGRDRGGQGFRIGSRKSDLCAVVYKRTGEPSAVEFRFQGQILVNQLRHEYTVRCAFKHVSSAWMALKQSLADAGDTRLLKAYASAGIGYYWPLYAQADHPGTPSLQSAFALPLGSDEHKEEFAAWIREQDAKEGPQEP